jgi:hypothetical protein
MTSLADELDFDPAFDDAHLGNHNGTSLSYEDEQEGNSSLDQSPVRSRGGRGARRGRQRARNSYSSDEQEHRGLPQQSLGEGFSLADELGGGSDQPGTFKGTTLAEAANDHEEAIPERSTYNNVGIMNEETKARKDREYYLTSSESLNMSLRATQSFLEKLKQTSSIPGGLAEHGRSMPSSGSSSNLLGSGLDDTSTLEGRAGQMLKQMREYSNVREDQIRELQECDRVLRRALEEGGDWISALANVDDLENDTSTDEPTTADDTLAFISDSHTRRPSALHTNGSIEDATMMEEDEGVLSADPSASFTRVPLSNVAMNGQQHRPWSDTSGPTICQGLASLQHSTLDLVSSLGSIHEQSQVARASMNDAARRIKTIKTVLTNWNEEIEAAERSRSHILTWESTGIESGSKPRDIRDWTDNHMEKFQRVLNDASIRAAELLSPVQDSVLDRLMAQG